MMLATCSLYFPRRDVPFHSNTSSPGKSNKTCDELLSQCIVENQNKKYAQNKIKQDANLVGFINIYILEKKLLQKIFFRNKSGRCIYISLILSQIFAYYCNLFYQSYYYQYT